MHFPRLCNAPIVWVSPSEADINGSATESNDAVLVRESDSLRIAVGSANTNNRDAVPSMATTMMFQSSTSCLAGSDTFFVEVTNKKCLRIITKDGSSNVNLPAYFTWSDVRNTGRSLAAYEQSVIDLNLLNWLSGAQV
ncbi:hypothetical protein EDD18DRAFT_1351934 [Armillaria luteobubalina]|uniref:Chitin synthase 4-like domain-containing protein n=1 Tax=Armillaria luteobubalina TaxID=153913 RepID=A0AA39UXI3_9AGAR|nr:hypothetical protein EDD18DRAFT_1351934 [Armillaria luteobubalina]